jgi:hypothetical protein
MLLKKTSELELRMSYFGLVPWFCIHADTPAGARECMKQIRAKPLEAHDPLVQWWAGTFGGHMDAVGREDEEASPELKEACKELDDLNLNENIGEGYHRATNLEQIRGHHRVRCIWKRPPD